MYVAAVLEYLAAEILELAGNATKDCRLRRIAPRQIQLYVTAHTPLHLICCILICFLLFVVVVGGGGVVFLRAIRGDEELDRVWGGVIAGGGVIPHIHKSLVVGFKPKQQQQQQ